MKCYIATFYQYNNYGTRLQTYALCHTIREMGAEPIVLAPDGRKEKLIRWLKDICSYMPDFNDRQQVWKTNRRKRKAFVQFNKQLNMHKITYSGLDNLKFNDAIAFAGSDQIWSPEHLRGRRRETELYFLRFAPKEKRYAYAPSFGDKAIPEELQEMYRQYVQEFAELSVREYAGQSILHGLTGIQVPVMPDPVFLLSREEWNQVTVSSEPAALKGRYVVAYFLSRQSSQVWEKIRRIAKRKRARLICIAGNICGEKDIIPTPDAFVRLIDSAQAVFTDSFHGTAFSIIMQTPFVVLRRKDVDQFSRIDTLLERYECKDAFIDDEERGNYKIFCIKDNSQINKIVEEEREKGRSYLKQIIRSNIAIANYNSCLM